jgi:hypothetical protein
VPTPPPELQRLDYFVGTWISQGQMHPTATTPGGTFRMIERNQWMDGGFFLILRSEFDTPGLSHGTGLAFMGYDSRRRRYTYDEFNSLGESQHSIGTLDAGAWIWTGEQHFGDATARTRLTMQAISPASYTLKFEISSDGAEWSRVMEGAARKETE